MNEHDYVTNALHRAYLELLKNDFTLLLFDVNERSITHRLAIYLEKYFPDYHVDCEYNRNGIGSRPKTLNSLAYELKNISPEDTNAKTVYPDIIIHRRGIPEGYVVIEAKKSNNSTDFDQRKLRAYKTELGYKYAFSVIFPVINDYPTSSIPKPNLAELIREI